ncbi:hypothetical protein RJ640_026621 [Escallonia rubra]|uniref:Carbohydrate kinase PfkB domain-containing protein n=1 Tax=Escallonia rubra TaxID=112253 RepID=A0AA88USS1_9ASTE|nr:hypothetical protein RJ640_026621 [Escallonia rubra]
MNISPPLTQASTALPPLPENRSIRRVRLQLGCGGVAVDLLAAVAAFPKPDDKIRTTSLMVQGGGNAGNALTCAARLGLNPRLISKVADDAQGRGILEELQADGVDTSFLVVSKEGNSPFTYVIVDNQTWGSLSPLPSFSLFMFVRVVLQGNNSCMIFSRKTRTCIHTPGFPPMIPDDLSKSSLLSALDGVRLVYFDVRLHETALVVAEEARRKSIPILIDAEKKRDGLDDLLNFSDYVVCTAKFPQAWTEAPSVPSALVSMLLRLPNLKFVIVTLGEDGCIMLERSAIGVQSEEIDIDSSLEELKQKVDCNVAIPTSIHSTVTKFVVKGVGMVTGRLFLGTAEKIPPSELVDTTGAGDAFIGAVLYAICSNMPPEKMLPFAAQVAAASCRALGARTGLPHRTDPRLSSFLI